MQFNDLGSQWNIIRDNVLDKIDKLGYQGSYINGDAVSTFEKEFATHYGAKYAVGVSNGTDGLKLALQTYELTNKDLVIIPANTFIADYLATKNIPFSSPTVALIDHDEHFVMKTGHLELFMETSRDVFNKIVVIPVHLYGHPCNMDKIVELSKKFDFSILEDCSQSHETTYKGKHVGSFGDMSVYSLYPGKNLGAMGDAGIITTNNKETYEKLCALRNYGSKTKYVYDFLGHNHRLDSIQAIVLSEKLKHLPSWTKTKNEIAQRYLDEIKNEKVILPKTADYCTLHSYHIFCLTVEDRKKFESHISKNNIPTIIHYPIPIHKTKLFRKPDIFFSGINTREFAEKIISIPIHPFLTNEEISHIITTINNYK